MLLVCADGQLSQSPRICGNPSLQSWCDHWLLLGKGPAGNPGFFGLREMHNLLSHLFCSVLVATAAWARPPQ